MGITSHLCKNAGIESSNTIVTMDSWFENMHCSELLRDKFWLHNLDTLNIGKTGIPKYDLTNLLEPKTVPQGTHVVYQHTDDDSETYFMVDWKVKSNRMN